MIDTLLEHLAPHPCCGCGKIGTLLCDNCKYDIDLGETAFCIACGSPASNGGICATCILPYQRGWCVGERSGVLKTLIDGLKFEHKKSAGSTLAELLDRRVDIVPVGTIVVPIPTVASHVRQRGYDHTLLIAKHFAKLRGLTVRPLLARATTTVQRGHSRKERAHQAAQAFTLKRGSTLDSGPYLLVDDVLTTGATLASAANVLRTAGAEVIWAAALARQPLD